MRTSFGQFKRPLPRRRDEAGLSPEDMGIVKAFNQGCNSGRADEPRRSPYMPATEQAKHEAWLCGYDELSHRYVVSKSQ